MDLDFKLNKFLNVSTKSSDTGRLPKRHNTAFNTQRKFEIKINPPLWGGNCKTYLLITAPDNQNGPCPPPPVSLPTPAPF